MSFLLFFIFNPSSFSALRPWRLRVSSFFLLSVLSVSSVACSPPAFPDFSTPTPTPFQPVPYTRTPAPTFTPTFTFTPVPTLTPTLPPQRGVWAGPALADGFRQAVNLPQGWRWVDSSDQAELRLEPTSDGDTPISRWVYALAAPFPTLTDEVSLEDVRQAWRGETSDRFGGTVLLVSPATLQAFVRLWGAADPRRVQSLPEGQILDTAWTEHAWALIPFEMLQPRWKVLRVDGKSPYDRGDLANYPLEIGYRISAESGAYEQFLKEGGSIPATNRDPGKLTVVLMTGTTALVRAVGWKMENLGMDYPARDILDWLHDADFTHISSESSFNPKCPPANPTQTSLMFCSRPEYIQLLEKAGANLIELTGNHNNDWGRSAFNYSLDLFRQHGWSWFGGGENAQSARQPLIVENHGNRLAFIGCNLPGPPNAWATADEPGAARCDLDWLEGELRGLRDQGILPVMTFQYNEVYIPGPSEAQARDFKRMASAGAVVVSGSQAHFPQGFALADGSLVHYGLGNLFFDQMDVPVVGTRREFLDRHVFYNGRYLGATLLTAMLEDYSRPRPMTPQEREEFLREIFKASGW